MIKNYFLTGPPRSGKTTLLNKIMEKLSTLNINMDGIICPEIRKGYARIGFKIISLKSGKEGILAKKFAEWTGPRVGKYIVNLKDLDEIGTKTIKDAITDKNIDIIIVDEIGIMELKSQNFQKAIIDALNSNKIVLGVIHQRSQHPLLRSIRKRNDTKIYEITRTIDKETREKIIKEIVENVVKLLEKNPRNRRPKNKNM